MKKSRLKKVFAAMAAGAVLPVLPVTAGPAAAEEVVCVQREHTTPRFPGGYPAMQFEFRFCVGRWHDKERAAWVDDYGWRVNWGTMPTKRFHHIVIKVRLERNNNVKDVTRCEFTRKANNHLAMPDREHPDELKCLPDGEIVSHRDGGWTADATLRYDIAWDEKGVITKHFAGTPSIR